MPYSYNWHTQDQDDALKDGLTVHSQRSPTVVESGFRAELKGRTGTSQTVLFAARVRISSQTFRNDWKLSWDGRINGRGDEDESPDSVEVWDQRELDWERVNYNLSGVSRRAPGWEETGPILGASGGGFSVEVLGAEKKEAELEFWDPEERKPIDKTVGGRNGSPRITVQSGKAENEDHVLVFTQDKTAIGSMKKSQYERQKHRFRRSDASRTLVEFVKENSPSLPNVVHTKSATAFHAEIRPHTPSDTDDFVEVDLLFTKDFPRYNKSKAKFLSEAEFKKDVARFRNNLWWTLQGKYRIFKLSPSGIHSV